MVDCRGYVVRGYVVKYNEKTDCQNIDGPQITMTNSSNLKKCLHIERDMLHEYTYSIE